MSRNDRKANNRISHKRSQRDELEQYERLEIPSHSASFKPLNFAQENYLRAIQTQKIVFGSGPAGTGKTFLAASYAASQLLEKKINKIIVTRPNIEVGRSMGFLPGTLEEKYAPYLEPFDAIFRRTLKDGFYEYCINKKAIDPRPLGYMRGSTFTNTIVLVDECQNMTKTEFRMLLSRIGSNCTVVLSGDPEQVDITDSGMEDALTRLSHIPGLEICYFLDSDIVRSDMCKRIIKAYRD